MAFDVLAWVQSRIPGGRVGGTGYYNVRCCFHQDGHPSLGVNTSTGSFKCKSASCGQRGDLVRLVMLLDGLTWQQACRLVDRPDPFDVDAVVPTTTRPDGRTVRASPTVNRFPHDLVAVSAARFPVYLRERGYGLEDAVSFGLHFGDDLAGRERGYLVFPYWSISGEYVTYAARRMSDGKDARGSRYQGPDHSVASRHLYGAWRFRGLTRVDRIFAVEGQFDAMRLWGFGLPAGALGTADATPAQYNQLAALSRAFDAPVCVLLDNGAHERERACRIVAGLDGLMVPAYVGELPVDVKDPDRLTGDTVAKLLDTCNTIELGFRTELEADQPLRDLDTGTPE